MIRDYLTTADVLGIHAVLIKRYGGAEGIRDGGAVEAAVFRPQCGYYADIVQEPCALFESLLMNHPFVDGNKRVSGEQIVQVAEMKRLEKRKQQVAAGG